MFGGESGIRTHGNSRFAGFQDQCLQPLGHLSLSCFQLRVQTQVICYHRSRCLSTIFSALPAKGPAGRRKNFLHFFIFPLAFSFHVCYYIKADIRVWRSLVSRLNGVQEALSSNLNTRTTKSRNPLKHNGLRDFSYSFSKLLIATTARLIFEENFENQEC